MKTEFGSKSYRIFCKVTFPIFRPQDGFSEKSSDDLAWKALSYKCHKYPAGAWRRSVSPPGNPAGFAGRSGAIEKFVFQFFVMFLFCLLYCLICRPHKTSDGNGQRSKVVVLKKYAHLLL